MIDRLMSIFRSDAFIPTSAVFPSIDTDQIARELKLKTQAAERAGRNLPRQEETTLDNVEMLIVDRIEEARRKGLENYESNKEVYSKRLGLASTAHLEVKSVAGAAEGDFSLEVKAYRAQMTSRVQALKEWYPALQAFRLRHDLKRPAYPDGSVPMTVFVVALCITVETALNGYLFAQKNELGYFGGFLIAGLVSIVNVGIASVAGFFSRLARHVSRMVRLCGLAIILGWIGLTGIFNLAVAHFRDAVETLEAWSAAATMSLDNVISDPFGLASIESWLLMLWGCLVALFAFLKFMYFGEPYLGYARISRRYDRALGEYADLLNDALGSLKEKRDAAIVDLQEANRIVREQIGDAVEALYGQKLMRSHLAAFLQQCDLKVNALLKIYRDENRAARDDPAPRHFDEPFEFAPFSDTEVEAHHAKNAEKELDAIGEIVDRAIEGIHCEYRALMREYPDPNTLIGLELTPPASPDGSRAFRDPPRRKDRLEIVEAAGAS